MKVHVRGSLKEAGQLQLMLCWLCEDAKEGEADKQLAAPAPPAAASLEALAEAAQEAANTSMRDVESVTVLPAGAVYAAPRHAPACCGCWTVLARLFQRRRDVRSQDPATELKSNKV
jgi:hypothetical protein